MSATELIAAAREHHVTLRVHQGQLLAKGGERLPPSLLATLRRQRDEVIRFLNEGSSDTEPRLRPGVALLVKCSKLDGQSVWFADDESSLHDPEVANSPYPVVFRDELAALRGQPAHVWRDVLAAKAAMPGARHVLTSAGACRPAAEARKAGGPRA